MPRPRAAALALLLLALTMGAAGAVQPAVFDLGQQFDRAQFRIAVGADGSAVWTFHYERTLRNESEVEQFEAFAATFNANETRLFTDFRNQSRTLAERGAASTGREMAASGFERRAFVTTALNDVGVVEMSFTWRGFAHVEGERVVVGDVFEGGLYVGPNQALVVRAADGLVFLEAAPEGTLSGGTLRASDTITWQGERTFADNHPRVVLVPAESAPATDGGADTTAGPGGGPPDEGAGSPLWPVALVLVVVAVAVGVFLYRRRGPTTGSTASAPPFDEAALLDDEERIAGLLEEHGGRMRQSDIVEETGWSKSKVSMVLSDMTDADQIRKLRVGRENIISLPGHEPDAARRRDELEE